jgi:hypothetical protein
MFPVNKNYNFMKKLSLKNGWAYVTFLELMIKNQLPIRVILTSKAHVPIYNSLMTIEKFDYTQNKTGDLEYKIELKEFYEKFLTFIDRDIEVIKYIRTHNIKQLAKSQLKKYGLIPENL